MKTHNKTSLITLAFIALMLFSLTSCYKNRFDLDYLEKNGEWAPEVALPLIYSQMSMKDILNDYDHNNLFVDDAAHFLYLIYNTKVYSATASEVINIPNQTLNTSFWFSVTGGLPYGTDVTAPPYTSNYSFNFLNGAVVDELYLGNMPNSFSFIINAPNFNHNATINISIPSATLNGVPFNQNVDIFGSAITQHAFNMAGYKLEFNNTGGNQNMLAVTYTVTVHGQGGQNNSPYNINMGEYFSNIRFSKIFGDLKQINFNMPGDSIQVRLFDNNIHGMIDFENPMIHLIAVNSFGMPVRINLNDFHATSGYNPPFDVLVTGIPSPWDIGYPSLAQVGQTVTTEHHLNKSNSNVWDAIAISPQWVVTDITGLTNPTGAPAANFALDTSRFSIDAQVELPLHGKAWDFILLDTIDDLTLGEDIDKAEYVTFRINTNNGFPVDAIQQVYFLNEHGVILDSLLVPEQQVVIAAPVGGAPDYRVTEFRHKLTEATIYQDRLVNLKGTKKALIKARLNTLNAGSQQVKIYSDYILELRVAFRAKFRINY